MQFFTKALISTTLLSALVAAAPSQSQLKTSLTPRQDATFDCDGSSQCKMFVDPSNCDAAVDSIDENHQYTTSDGSDNTGVCHRNCAVFIEGGDSCSYSGKDLKDNYQQIRDYGCDRCGGSSLPGVDCKIKVDYVSGSC